MSATPFNNEHMNCRLEFVKQPKQNFRFRYGSELSDTTHGVLLARDAILKNEYPSVKLTGVVEDTKYFIVCVLYEYIDCRPYLLSAHQLMRKTRKRKSTESKKNDAYENSDPIVISVDCPEQIELANLYITKTMKTNAEGILKRKREKLSAYFPSVKIDMNPTLSKLGNRVCIGITACKKYQERYEPITETIYSDPIVNSSELAIKKLLTKTVNIDGGEEIYVLASGIRANDITLRLYTHDEDGVTTWEHVVAPQVVQSKNTIFFKAPKYEGEMTDDTLKCWLELIRPSENMKSIPHSFFYVRTSSAHEKQPLELGLRCKLNKVHMEIVSIISEHVEPVEMWDNIVHFNRAYKLRSDSTIFHELLAIDSFSVFYKLCNIAEVKSACRTALNGAQQNLLHYACKLNKADAIGALVAVGHMLCALDNARHTPLHVAILERHHDCIAKFGEIFSCSADYPDAIAELRELLSVYDRLGHTVLHLAVLHNLYALAKSMLQFGIQQGIDFGAIKTETAGETILHLAVDKKLTNMANLIIENVPNACDYVNGAGKTVFQMTPASKYQNTIKAISRYSVFNL